MQALIDYALEQAKAFTADGTDEAKTKELTDLLNGPLVRALAGSQSDMNALVDFYDKHLSPTPRVSSDKSCPLCVTRVKACFEAIANFFAA